MSRFLRVSGPVLIAGLVHIIALAAPRSAPAAGFAVLTSFNYRAPSPNASLVQGGDGNFYGTTGGYENAGTVFKMTPAGVVTILHAFHSNSAPNDGYEPNAALVQGADGNFYGTTFGGGSAGFGTVFKITPTGTETILHNFGGDNFSYDGGGTYGGLVQGTDGNFYGTTIYGGTTGNGTVFKITPAGTLTTLYNFSGYDGGGSFAALIQGADGNFYGTNHSAVFKVTPAGVETTLHDFYNGNAPPDGNTLNCALVQGADGNFYGTTTNGGSTVTERNPGDGIVFKITPAGVETVLHDFGDGSVPNDGTSPIGGLVQGSDGDFYGTTEYGGSTVSVDIDHKGFGTIFKITPDGKETVVHDFSPSPYSSGFNGDGVHPTAALAQGADGDLYGTAFAGGSDDSGATYRLTLTSAQPPTITSFTPGEGPISSFAPDEAPVSSFVTLTGTDLDSVSAVRFHDASAKYFYSNVTGTQLTVFVPDGAMKGTITVTNSLGSATTVNPFRITYAPVITSFSPTSSPVGTVVTITGTHLDGITRVRFHEADATVYSSNAAGTQLTVTVPPGAKTGTLTLDNRDALATTSSGVFTVTP